MTPAAGEKKLNNSRNQLLVSKKKLGKRTSKMIFQNPCWVGFRWLVKPRYRGLHIKRKTAIQNRLFLLYGMSFSKFQLSTEKGALDVNWSCCYYYCCCYCSSFLSHCCFQKIVVSTCNLCLFSLSFTRGSGGREMTAWGLNSS